MTFRISQIKSVERVLNGRMQRYAQLQSHQDDQSEIITRLLSHYREIELDFEHMRQDSAGSLNLYYLLRNLLLFINKISKFQLKFALLPGKQKLRRPQKRKKMSHLRKHRKQSAAHNCRPYSIAARIL